MLLTNHETFLSEMSKLFYSNQTNGGSIYITMKRVDNSKKPTPRTKPRPSKSKKQSSKKQPQSSSSSSTTTTTTTEEKMDVDQKKEYQCLIRVHDRKRKISIIVSAKDVNKFQQAYSNLLKGNLYGLKKKDKKKVNKKSKATQ